MRAPVCHWRLAYTCRTGCRFNGQLAGHPRLAAFAAGEVACEALGACHLLAHGIWAFKTSAAGERTDLVLGAELAVSDEVRRASQGLVLTDWKCVRSESELQRKCREAVEQARRYREGILAGFEVGSPRYLVMVSPDHLSMPSPQAEGDVMYEFRNIAVDPSSPSRGARVPAPPGPPDSRQSAT